jgi:hypothetical protein
MFLKELQARHLFWLDSDIGWPAEKVIEFLQRPEDILVGLYRRREDQIALPCDFSIADQKLVERDDGFIKLNRAATGFMRIKRHVIEKLCEGIDTYLVPTLSGEEIEVPNLFQVGPADHPDGRRYHGEDMLFSQRCVDAGFEIWLDPDVTLTHVGKKAWAFNCKQALPELREVAAKASADAWTLRVG